MTYSPTGGGNIATSGDVALNNPTDKQALTYKAGLATWTNANKTLIVKLTQAEYNALEPKNENTLYVVVASMEDSTLNTATNAYYGSEQAQAIFLSTALVWSAN